jgi:glycosyltransferase involved in cell wall biosynthesis
MITTRKTRVMVLVDSMSNGGTERVLLALLPAFNPDNYTITLVSLSGAGALTAELPESIELIPLYANSTPARFYKIAIKGLVRLYRTARASKVLIGTCPTTHLLAHLLGKVARRPVVAWVHYVWGGRPLDGTWGSKVKQAYRATKNFIFVSEDSRQRFISGMFDGQLPEGVNAAVIHNPIPPRALASTTLPMLETFLAEHPKAKPVLFVGRLVAVKNVSDVIEAIFLVRQEEPDAFLAVIGTGPLVQSLKREAQTLASREVEGSAQKPVPPVLFLGEDHNPLPVMARATVLALASKSEAWGVVAVEAMTQRCAVVAYAAPGGLPEMLTSDPSAPRGKLVTDQTPAGLASALLSVLRNDQGEMLLAAKTYADGFKPGLIANTWHDYLTGQASPIHSHPI